jgi:FkbM family methyltransferase
MHTLDLDDVLVRLIEKGHGAVAVDPIRDSVIEMLAGDAADGFELEDLYEHLEANRYGDLVPLLRECVAELEAEQVPAWPWLQPDYNLRKWESIGRGIGAPAGSAYGRSAGRLDERVVEYPWVFDRISQLHPRGEPALDAGSVMNHDLVQQAWKARGFGPVSVVTLAYEGHARVSDHFRFEFADLRTLPYRDAWFSSVLCISTLEHVGMDNSIYGVDGHRHDHAHEQMKRALGEMARVLVPAGTLLLSLPFGRPADRGWLRVFSLDEVRSLFDAAHWGRITLRVFRAFADGWREVSPAEAADAGYNDPRGIQDAPRWVAAAEAVVLIECVRAGAERPRGWVPAADVEATHPEYGYRFRFSADDRFVGDALARGAYERIESALFLSLVERDSVVVDVGANLGHYSILAASRIEPGRGRIVAFEPNTRAHDLLAQNLALNGCNWVERHRLAVGERPGAVQLHLNRDNAGDHRVFHALREDWGAGVETVDSVDLDSFVEASGIEPTLVKIDVQGFEYFVLQGMKRLLERTTRIAVILEFSPELNLCSGVNTEEQFALIQDTFEDVYCIDPVSGQLTPADETRVLALCDRHEHANLLCLKGYPRLSGSDLP